MAYTMYQTNAGNDIARARKYSHTKPNMGVYSKYRNLNGGGTGYQPTGINAVTAKLAKQRQRRSRAPSAMEQYQSAYNAARQREEQRYKELKSGYMGRYRRGMQMLEGMGSAARDELNRNFDKLGSQTASNMTAMGLANTTVPSSMAQGVERERSQAQRLQEEQLRRERLAADAQLSGDTLQFMERPTTEYPDMAMMAQLVAQGGGGAGGGGYGGGMSGAAPAFMGSYGMGGMMPFYSAQQGGGGGQRPLTPYQQQLKLANQMKKINGGIPGVNLGATTQYDNWIV